MRKPIYLENTFELNTGMVEPGGGAVYTPQISALPPPQVLELEPSLEQILKVFLFTQILINFLDFMTNSKSEF